MDKTTFICELIVSGIVCVVGIFLFCKSGFEVAVVTTILCIVISSISYYAGYSVKKDTKNKNDKER